jgi:hypothetical protein
LPWLHVYIPTDFFPYERCAFRRDFLAAAIVAESRQMQWWWHTLVVGNVGMKRAREMKKFLEGMCAKMKFV